MNPVIGLDVSKGESHAQAFTDRGVPHGKMFQFEHNLEGLASFLNFVHDLECITGLRPAVLLEATGHYHSPVIQFLYEHQYLYIVINPLISTRPKNHLTQSENGYRGRLSTRGIVLQGRIRTVQKTRTIYDESIYGQVHMRFRDTNICVIHVALY